MARTITTSLSLASLTLACSLALACSDSSDPTRHEPARPAPTSASATTPASTPAPATATTTTPTVETPTITAATTTATPEPSVELAIAAPLPSEQPVLTNTTTLELPKTASARTRAAMVPAGTPDANALAFVGLPLSKRDQAPVGGIGASGVHVDELSVGKGWIDSRCEQPTTRFDANVTGERVNVCFRVVHPKLEERVNVEWALGGKLRTTTSVGVKASHAYLTRAWLPVGPSRAGQWTATVKSEDGVVLGQVAFEITK